MSFQSIVVQSTLDAINSGISALETMLIYYNVRGKKMAVPTNTNFASVATIIKNGAKPIFLDMEPDYFLPSLDNLKYIYKNIKLTNVGSYSWYYFTKFDGIVEFCESNNVRLIEVARMRMAVNLKVNTGTFGDGGIFVFPTK